MPTTKQLAKADDLLTAVEWSRFDAMADEDIRAAWAWDTDTIWPTEAELAVFKLVPAAARPERANEAAE